MKFSVSIRFLVDLAGFSYASFMRWQRRIKQGKPAVGRPGPPKVSQLNFDSLQADINRLKHCCKRTHGTGSLYRQYHVGISRRELNEMVKEARSLRQQAYRSEQWQLTWKHPNLVWAMDGCELPQRILGYRLHVQNVQDLCSTYKLDPLVTRQVPSSKEVANHLFYAFKIYGPPLFLKRDNAGNFNGSKVNEVLRAFWVIPVNSPCYYAQYNGAIEHAQGEVKSYAKQWQGSASTVKEACLRIKFGIHDLNHKSRRILNRQNACQCYHNRNQARFSKRERRCIFNWIRNLAFAISVKSGMDKISSTAWRIACRKWMEENGMLVIRKQENVLPNSFLNLCHN